MCKSMSIELMHTGEQVYCICDIPLPAGVTNSCSDNFITLIMHYNSDKDVQKNSVAVVCA